MLLAYASRTGSSKNLDALREFQWRLLISARGVHRHEGFPYAIDNGAWTSHQKGEPFQEAPFRQLLRSHGELADWVVVPDIVAGGEESLKMSTRWIPEVLSQTRQALFAVQDGMSPAQVVPLLGSRVGIFVGGSTEWKLQTLPEWGRVAEARGCWLHVGRVNSARRIHLCGRARAHSFDGTSATKFSVTTAPLSRARDVWSLTSPRTISHIREATQCPP